MAILRTVGGLDLSPILAGDGVRLRAPTMSDHAEWATLREASHAFLAPWEPTWPSDDLTRSSFRRRLRHYAQDIRDDQAYPFFVFRVEDGALVGGLTLSNVRRGVSQSCALGYWMGERFAGRGYMTAAVRAIVPFVFGSLRLHRLEAACLPHNTASIRLLERVGFRHEGLARRYLCINGAWQDHLLYALLTEDTLG